MFSFLKLYTPVVQKYRSGPWNESKKHIHLAKAVCTEATWSPGERVIVLGTSPPLSYHEEGECRDAWQGPLDMEGTQETFSVGLLSHGLL